ncbi:MAG TPA: DUF6268 family outer membrane beta-barrel protein [Candidatus Polarisedimenticolia bacterium]|nr:DUF6268 family outer membrane beta-barrel protein [Candidatus Polarisedimenticolia bacterium]
MRSTGRLPRWGATLGIFLLALAAGGRTARAQEDLELQLFRPRLEIAAERTPDKPFRDITGDFAQRAVELKVNIPLGPTIFHPQSEHLLGHQVFAQVQYASAPTDISFLSRTPRLQTGAVRVAALFLSQHLNLYGGMLGASFAEDDKTIHNLDARFSGLGFGTYRKTEKLTFLYGGVVSYQYGRRLTVPLFGVSWRYRSRWTLFSVVPFLAKTTYTGSEKLRLSFQLAVAGNRYRFSNEGDFPGEPETIFLRLRQARLGAEIEYFVTRDTSFVGEAGVQNARTLDFTRTSRPDSDFFSEPIEPAGYVKVAWRHTFGKSLVEKMQEQRRKP